MPPIFICTSYKRNRQGLLLNHLWQKDVIHIAEFGKLKYVHVAIDTYSDFLIVTAQTGEVISIA